MKIRFVLALVWAINIVATSNADASVGSPYLICEYKGMVNFAFPAGITFSCWVNLTGKTNCGTDIDTFYVTAASTNAGDAVCANLFWGNFPWVGSLAAIATGSGVVDTTAGTTGALPWSGFEGSGPSPIFGGALVGVGAAGTQMHTCNKQAITMPSQITVTDPTGGSPGNFGPMFGTYSIFETVGPDHLEKKGCHVVL